MSWKVEVYRPNRGTEVIRDIPGLSQALAVAASEMNENAGVKNVEVIVYSEYDDEHGLEDALPEFAAKLLVIDGRFVWFLATLSQRTIVADPLDPYAFRQPER